MGKEAYHLERRAYRAIKVVEELNHRRARARNATASKRRSIGQRLRAARGRMDAAIDRYDRFEELRREAARVLDLTDRGCGRLRTAGEVVEVLTRIADEMKEIGGRRVRRVAEYIGNRAEGLGRSLDNLAARLQARAEEAGGDQSVDAAVRAYQAASRCRAEARSGTARRASRS